MMNNSITAIPGIRVGNVTDLDAITGCTVILCPENTIGGVDQRGGAPGTRETDLLRPMHLVQHVHAIVLSGGSAYGLAAADGVMRYLEEQGIGYPVGDQVVPIVPAAILMDLLIGQPTRPNAEMGYTACTSASTAPVEQGNIGAGTGCRIGALAGGEMASKGGLGSAAIKLENGVIVAALVAVNAIGDVMAENGDILAGMRNPDGSFVGALNALRMMAAAPSADNTVIGVVASNALLDKEQTNLVARMAHDGLARAIRPAHTLYDGDTIFSLSTGHIAADANLVGAYAAEMMSQAIRNGVRAATPIGGMRFKNPSI